MSDGGKEDMIHEGEVCSREQLSGLSSLRVWVQRYIYFRAAFPKDLEDAVVVACDLHLNLKPRIEAANGLVVLGRKEIQGVT